MNKITEKWLEFVTWMSSKGIPFPLLRDPRTQDASLTFSMVVISFTMCTLALIGKVASSNAFGSLDFNNSLQLFLATGGLYWGRAFQKGDSKLSAPKADKVDPAPARSDNKQ